ncbi:MAG: CRISPR-associated endoribonuclease Cas6 [Prolixibacteraceae bacterium]|nr:CRISPR-associated endoribonuclease Cas6 [Prolixibacteraceae bacterium]
MRAYLTLQTQNTLLPFDHRDLITQTIHRWLGWSDNHSKLPPYSFSRFEGIQNSNDGIWFKEETAFFFSAPNVELVRKLEAGVKANPSLFNGLIVSDIKILEDSDLSNRKLFFAASPLLMNPIDKNQGEFIVYNMPNVNTILKENTLRKLKAAGINDETFDIEFDKNYANAGTKKITYNGRIMRASWCQIILKGLPETKQYLWNVGLGDNTDIGFGAIM